MDLKHPCYALQKISPKKTGILRYLTVAKQPYNVHNETFHVNALLSPQNLAPSDIHKIGYTTESFGKRKMCDAFMAEKSNGRKPREVCSIRVLRSGN